MARIIFISYERHNRAQVARLASDIQRSGHRAFFDQELTGGTPWWDRLLDNIEQCDLFMPVVSEDYTRSDPCAREAAYAGDLGKPFLPVSLGSPSPALFARRIAESQWVRYDPDDRDTLLDLSRALNLAPACPPSPAERPLRPEVPISYMDEWVRKIEDPAEMPRADQMLLLSELRARSGSDDREAVESLLRRFRARADITYQVATEIDALLATPAASTVPSEPAPAPQPVSAAPRARPRPPRPRRAQVGRRPQTPAPMGAPAKPENYMVWAILTTLFCCLPLGAVGIYFAMQVDKLYHAGDLAGSQTASNNARTWIIVSAVLGVIVFGIVGLLAISSPQTNSTP